MPHPTPPTPSPAPAAGKDLLDFYSSEQVRHFYRDHISAITQRNNTYNARRYKDDPTIMMYDVSLLGCCACGRLRNCWFRFPTHISLCQSLHVSLHAYHYLHTSTHAHRHTNTTSAARTASHTQPCMLPFLTLLLETHLHLPPHLPPHPHRP